VTHRRHPSLPPEVEKLLTALVDRGVRFVLVGSVAAAFYGFDVEPGDLDVTPAMDARNLDHLGGLLEELEAWPAEGFGRWEVQPDGERKWIDHEPSPEERAARDNWRPDPGAPESFDSLFHTTLGDLDIVPEVCGPYASLVERAASFPRTGGAIQVAHVDDLLIALTMPRRARDAGRIRHLRQVQRSARS